MPFKAKLPEIERDKKIILPISMAQPLEQGARLEAILTALIANNHHQQTTILVCDYLNRFNCTSEDEALEQGKKFLLEHQELLSHFTVIRWQDFLTKRQEKFHIEFDKIQALSQDEQSMFYQKMKKTWEKCLVALKQNLNNSLNYQREEYAAILCMDEFDVLIYPKKITDGLAYFYRHIEGKKPQYQRIVVNELPEEKNKQVSSVGLFKPSSLLPSHNNHVHVALRGVLSQIDFYLNSPEISDASKRLFLEELQNKINIVDHHLKNGEIICRQS